MLTLLCRCPTSRPLKCSSWEVLSQATLFAQKCLARSFDNFWRLASLWLSLTSLNDDDVIGVFWIVFCNRPDYGLGNQLTQEHSLFSPKMRHAHFFIFQAHPPPPKKKNSTSFFLTLWLFKVHFRDAYGIFRCQLFQIFLPKKCSAFAPFLQFSKFNAISRFKIALSPFVNGKKELTDKIFGEK